MLLRAHLALGGWHGRISHGFVRVMPCVFVCTPQGLLVLRYITPLGLALS